MSTSVSLVAVWQITKKFTNSELEIDTNLVILDPIYLESLNLF